MILKDQSEYFEAILRNNCKENDEKKMIIDDFEPKVVEIFLRHIYNGAVCENATEYCAQAGPGGHQGGFERTQVRPHCCSLQGCHSWDSTCVPYYGWSDQNIFTFVF